jgi:hypothetical protein
MALDALQSAAVEFCKISTIWKESLDGDIEPCRPFLELSPSEKGSVVTQIIELFINGRRIDPLLYGISSHNVLSLTVMPSHNDMHYHALAVVRPDRNATRIPEQIVEEWGEIISAGAIAKLKLMTGTKVEWSDPQGAAFEQQRFIEGAAQARIQEIREQHGSKGALTVFDSPGGIWI